jgi:hypothetical protein
MNFTINNGRRVQVAFGGYAGKAGVVTHEGATRVSFFADHKQFRDVAAGAIEGEPFNVVAAEKSDPERNGVRGMVVLTVEPAG